MEAKAEKLAKRGRPPDRALREQDAPTITLEGEGRQFELPPEKPAVVRNQGCQNEPSKQARRVPLVATPGHVPFASPTSSNRQESSPTSMRESEPTQ